MYLVVPNTYLFCTSRAQVVLMAKRPRVRKPVIDTLDTIREEQEFGSYDEAITYALREAGYNV